MSPDMLKSYLRDQYAGDVYAIDKWIPGCTLDLTDTFSWSPFVIEYNGPTAVIRYHVGMACGMSTNNAMIIDIIVGKVIPKEGFECRGIAHKVMSYIVVESKEELVPRLLSWFEEYILKTREVVCYRESDYVQFRCGTRYHVEDLEFASTSA